MSENARLKLFDAICDLVLERGYGGTSVDAICERANVSKGSFFHHFPSKEAAACETLDHWMTAMVERARASGFMEQASAVDRLLTYLNLMASLLESPTSPKGCLLGTLALELSDTHPQVRERAAHYFEQWSGMLESLIADALAANDGCPKPRALADYFIASLEGSILLARTRQEPSLVRKSVHHFRDYVLGMIPGAGPSELSVEREDS
ncbi:MAG: TetR/AcrR family transcriptional regulator [Planctomycetaceae bacterium]|nr:TetR/AcrR family transcriptional regulator [Planctomycetaceae bacterium]